MKLKDHGNEVLQIMQSTQGSSQKPTENTELEVNVFVK